MYINTYINNVNIYVKILKIITKSRRDQHISFEV
jgi:hypothetical protein